MNDTDRLMATLSPHVAEIVRVDLTNKVRALLAYEVRKKAERVMTLYRLKMTLQAVAEQKEYELDNPSWGTW